MLSRLMIIATCLSASPALADLAGQEKDNYYASGKAQADTQIAAERAACDNAKRELISYVFGLSTKVNSNFVQTLDKVHLTQTVDVNSDWLSLKGLQQTLSSTTDEKGMLISECRILYSLAEAKLEKNRIEKARALLEREKLNRASFENSDPVNFGRLTVRSNAPKTKVFLDGVHWGWAPLEVDRVPVGEHQISLSADGYITEAMGIDLKIGEAKIVFVAMKKNLAKLQLLNLPARSTVWINGLMSSASRYDLDPGEVIIRVEAPYYMPYQDALTLAAGANLEHSIHMVAKLVPVSFVSKGEKADVFINGASIGKTPISKDLVLGDYSVDFMTAVGIIHKTNLTVTPGAKLSVVAPPAPKSSSASARFSPVVLYKDSSLSVRKDYASFRAIPAFSSGSATSFSIELMEPKEGFIYVNGKLAGKRSIVVDDVDSFTTIKIEAPGYYPSTLALNPDNVEQGSSLNSHQLIWLARGSSNDFKAFLLRKRPQLDSDEIAVAIGLGDHYSLTKGRIVGFYAQFLPKPSFFSVEPPTKIQNISPSASGGPAVIINVPDAADKAALSGQVTEILLSDPKSYVSASEVFLGSSGNVLPRTIFIGHAYFFPAIDRSSGGLSSCGSWGMQVCSSHTFGAPFAVKKLRVGNVDVSLENAKRYSH